MSSSQPPASPPVYAHTLGPNPADWETLPDHADRVAAHAADFAAAFGAADWGRLAGLWHDLGKAQPDFQAYLRGQLAVGPPHAWTGAVLAATQSRAAYPLAFAIAGHHTGLADMQADATLPYAAGPTPLKELLSSLRQEWATLHPRLPAADLNRQVPPLPARLLVKAPDARLQLEMFTRFLFSALVDADRVATARFYAQHQPALTADDLSYDDLPALRDRLDARIDAMPPKGSPAVVDLRRQVLTACRARAADPPGRFSLTVPTGGGKTLSAMSFALNHAVAHGRERVIVVIPYTSIIEQSARVYKDVLGPANVLEHHSNLDEQKLHENDARGEDLRKLAAENWDAPIIVTTTVQFFESLLANHPGRCRKLHNIANSVVVLDEVQTLPPQFLKTILDVLGQLTDHYRCTAVLTTATPPALRARDNSLRPGLTHVREIMPDPSTLARAVRRVRVEWRTNAVTPYADLAAELRRDRQALAIVHRRQDARTLAEAVGGDVLHLSALMCPAHRLDVIDKVRRRLAKGKPCALVSTQLIEAGVDVDFPTVYRALAGLDSIAQSAGRCDREGKLTDANNGVPAGRMVVFLAETDPPPGVPKKAFDSMSVLLALGRVDPFDPDHSVRFFDELYGKIDADERRVDLLRRNLMFAQVATAFRLIDNDTHPVVVPYGDARQRLAKFRANPCRQTQQALQPYTVQVRRFRLLQLRDVGVAEPVDEFDRFDFVCEGRDGSYHQRFGLDERADPVLAAEDSVI